MNIAFLQKEEICMLLPEGFVEINKENLVCRLNKSPYCLKQAPRCWYKRFDSFKSSLGYYRLCANHCTCYKRFGDDNNFIIFSLYVDDLLVVGPNKDRVQELKAQLAREFDMKEGPTNKIRGMQIHRDRNNRKIWLSKKPVFTPLPVNFKLSSSMCPSNEAERREMS